MYLLVEECVDYFVGVYDDECGSDLREDFITRIASPNIGEDLRLVEHIHITHISELILRVAVLIDVIKRGIDSLVSALEFTACGPIGLVPRGYGAHFEQLVLADPGLLAWQDPIMAAAAALHIAC